MEEKRGLSRRQFLADAGLLVGGATVGAVALSSCGKSETTVTTTQTATVTNNITNTVTKTITEQGEAVYGGRLININLTINGQGYNVDVEPELTLQELLHNRLGFISIKDMCTGYGACGSCSAILDGRPVLTCMVLAVECDGHVIETAEGIAQANHPLVQAYIDNDCMQCGYCTPGFLVTAKALLDKKSNPTDEDIIDALGGNLCRCGTYPQHILAIHQAAKGGK